MEQLPKRIKKLIFSNRYTFDDISKLTGEPLEKCISAFESYYRMPIPPSLLIVGNEKVRADLKEYISASDAVFLYGNNGVGKDISLRKISEELGLTLRKCTPTDEDQIIQAFGEAPFEHTDFLFVIDIESLNKKKYSILKKYVSDNESAVVLTGMSKDSVNKRILDLLVIVKLSDPSPVEVKEFLKRKYSWNGDIRDVYDSDMRVVISRVLNEIDGTIDYKPVEEKEIKSGTLAFDLSCGYAKREDFGFCKEPLWWVIRWLAYNQYKKFPRNKRVQLENLRKLSEIDFKKRVWKEKYLREMLLDLKTSPVRTRFSFPVWQKKITAEEEDEIEKLKKAKEKPKPKIVVAEPNQVDFSQWI